MTRSTRDPNDKPFNPRNARQPDAGVPYIIAEGEAPHYVSGHGRCHGGELVRISAAITPSPGIMRLTEDEYAAAASNDDVRIALASKARFKASEDRSKQKVTAGARKADGPTIEQLREEQDARRTAEDKAAASEAEVVRLKAELEESEAARQKEQKATAGAPPPNKKADSDKPKP
jgi:hypothetical protein